MLPAIGSLAEYVPVYRDAATWLPALQVICRRHGFDPDTLRMAPPGSNVVFWVEPGCLVKLFAPMWTADATREAIALRALAGARTSEVPRILAEGSLEGWPYLIISRLPGWPLDEVWPALGEGERLVIARELGRLMASLHSISTSGLSALHEDWPAFVRNQAQVCLKEQAQKGVSADWLAQIAAFLDEMLPTLLLDFKPVFLHADLNPEHLFCSPVDGEWRLSGVIDFGDAMLGHPLYEFVCTGFILGPDPALRRAMLESYGYPAGALNEALSRRLMAYTLLHRFASLPEMLSRFEQPPAGLAGLQAALWGFD